MSTLILQVGQTTVHCSLFHPGTHSKTLLERYTRPLLLHMHMHMQMRTQTQIAFVRVYLDLWIGGCVQSYMGLVTSVAGAGDCSRQDFFSWWQSAQRKKVDRTSIPIFPYLNVARPPYPHLRSNTSILPVAVVHCMIQSSKLTVSRRYRPPR